jgi:hypothetical protein
VTVVADTALAGTPVAVTISIDVPVRMWDPTSVCNQDAGLYDVTANRPNTH